MSKKSADEDRAKKASGRVLLPSHVVPTRYDLSIEPDLEAFTFTGTVDITFDVDASKVNDTNDKEITLHAKELSITKATFKTNDDDTKKGSCIEMRQNIKATTVVLIFDTSFAGATTVVLTIEYCGFLNNQMAGFYRSPYTDAFGNTKIMASTQFESLDARRAFPCVDEPAAKAVFGVTLTVPAELTCFSNMPEEKVDSVVVTKGNNNKKKLLKRKVQFLPTPKMSTYLVAFCVGEFDSVSALCPKSGVLCKVYTPPGKSHLGEFSLKVAVESLDLYNDFFGIPYPLFKLDLVAIPEFAMGAMENWGLVTFREVDLLIDPIKASSNQKQRVAIVVAHELAHQWFGNLVTMTWWDDLWLNEGFASWCEHDAIHKLFPDYKMWEQFTTGHLASAMRSDALRSSHAIQVPIGHAEEVEQVFDAISYCKGASVVRMICAVLGPEQFQAGLAHYMKRHAYGNTETFDLWNAWQEVSKIPVGDMMKSWTEQMGFPLVKVVKEDFQADKVVLELEQVWFLSDGSELSEEDAKKKWTIPILTCTNAGPQADMTLMREQTATVTIPLSDANNNGAWVKLNAGQEVPMRVLLGPEMLKRLSTAISNKTLSPMDRAGLLHDSFALTKAGHLPPESLIQLLVNYKQEDNYIVWDAISAVMAGLDSILSDDDTMSGYFTQFCKGFVLKLMEKVGWQAQESDGHLGTLLRGIMVSMLARFCCDDPTVASEAKTRFEALQQDPNDVKSVPSDLRTPIFKIYVKNGGKAEYDAVMDFYLNGATDDAERKHVYYAIGHTQDAALKRQTLQWAISGKIKLQDFFFPLGSVGHSGKVGREIAWQFFQDEFEILKTKYGATNANLMGAAIVTCCGSFCSMDKATEIEAFFEKNPLPDCTRKISQVLETMRANAKLLTRLQESPLSKPDFWEGL